MPQRSPRVDKAELTLKVAAGLFSGKGYMQTTYEDIIAAAGISKGAIYYYFKSKEEILFAIIERFLDLELEEIEKGLGEVGSAKEKLAFIVGHHISFYVRHSAEGKTILHEYNNLPPHLFEKIAEKERRYYKLVSSVLQDYLGKRLDPKLLTPTTFALFGMCNWIYSWYDAKKSVNASELADLFVNILMRGIDGLPDPHAESA